MSVCGAELMNPSEFVKCCARRKKRNRRDGRKLIRFVHVNLSRYSHSTSLRYTSKQPAVPLQILPAILNTFPCLWVSCKNPEPLNSGWVTVTLSLNLSLKIRVWVWVWVWVCALFHPNHGFFAAPGRQSLGKYVRVRSNNRRSASVCFRVNFLFEVVPYFFSCCWNPETRLALFGPAWFRNAWIAYTPWYWFSSELSKSFISYAKFAGNQSFETNKLSPIFFSREATCSTEWGIPSNHAHHRFQRGVCEGGHDCTSRTRLSGLLRLPKQQQFLPLRISWRRVWVHVTYLHGSFDASLACTSKRNILDSARFTTGTGRCGNWRIEEGVRGQTRCCHNWPGVYPLALLFFKPAFSLHFEILPPIAGSAKRIQIFHSNKHGWSVNFRNRTLFRLLS
jgi:hypothetical protein